MVLNLQIILPGHKEATIVQNKCLRAKFNGSQLAKMKKSIPDMFLP